MADSPTSYVCKITAAQAEQLRDILLARGWELKACPYAFWSGAGPAVKIIAYESGKLVVQGKGTAEFVQFTLEPEILGEARFGYENDRVELEMPDMFTPHAGIDESGKGDYFGPLVIAAAYVDEGSARQLLDAGVADSKTIKSERKIQAVAEKIRQITAGRFGLVAIGPEAYNRLYAKLRNVNKILAWGHARALENLLEKVPDCPRALSDQFTRRNDVGRALLQRGRDIKLEQRTKAESDVAVAAASILARCEFVRRMERLGQAAGFVLPKGAGHQVIEAGQRLVRDKGAASLQQFAKLHFKTTHVITDATDECLSG
jgi:ribonuclease HIII